MVETRNQNPIKDRFGIPHKLRSCHTAKIGNYFLEGHIPAKDIKRLMADKPDIKGLIVPGMPGGSPGMESSPYQPYEVLSMNKNGRMGIYSKH
jgi:hypothetical protein